MSAAPTPKLPGPGAQHPTPSLQDFQVAMAKFEGSCASRVCSAMASLVAGAVMGSIAALSFDSHGESRCALPQWALAMGIAALISGAGALMAERLDAGELREGSCARGARGAYWVATFAWLTCATAVLCLSSEEQADELGCGPLIALSAPIVAALSWASAFVLAMLWVMRRPLPS